MLWFSLVCLVVDRNCVGMIWLVLMLVWCSIMLVEVRVWKLVIMLFFV